MAERPAAARPEAPRKAAPWKATRRPGPPAARPWHGLRAVLGLHHAALGPKGLMAPVRRRYVERLRVLLTVRERPATTVDDAGCQQARGMPRGCDGVSAVTLMSCCT